MNSSVSDVTVNLINYSIRNIVNLLDWITSPTILGVAIFLSFNAFHAIASRQREIEAKLQIWRYNARVFYALCAALLISASIRNIKSSQNDWSSIYLFSIVVISLAIVSVFIVIRRREQREKDIETQVQAQSNPNKNEEVTLEKN